MKAFNKVNDLGMGESFQQNRPRMLKNAGKPVNPNALSVNYGSNTPGVGRTVDPFGGSQNDYTRDSHMTNVNLMQSDDIGGNHVKFGTVMDTDDVQNGLG